MTTTYKKVRIRLIIKTAQINKDTKLVDNKAGYFLIEEYVIRNMFRDCKSNKK